MKLYLEYAKVHFKCAMQYKVSFILSCLSQIVSFFVYYFSVFCLFDKFSVVKGFTIYEVLFTLGIIVFGTGFCETFLRGIDEFDKVVINGEFDKILLRPRGIIFQVVSEKIEFSKMMKMIQGLIVLVIAIINLNIQWNLQRILTLLFMMTSSVLIFASIFILSASYCFITIKGLEIRNILTDGCKDFAQYPIGVFKKGIIFFLTFILPFGFVNYYPLLYVLGKSNNSLLIISPFIIVIYFVLSILIFYKLSKRYTSAGS